MKVLKYCILAVMCAALSSGGAENDFREFVADVEEVKKACEAARIVHFKEAKLSPWFARKNEEFLFRAVKEYTKVVFKSKKLAALCEKMGEGNAFTEFIGRSLVFGLQKRVGELEGRLFVGTICGDTHCRDEEYVLIFAE